MKCKNSNTPDNKMNKSLNELPCDGCGKHFSGNIFPIYDENYNVQEGLNLCSECNFKNI